LLRVGGESVSAVFPLWHALFGGLLGSLFVVAEIQRERRRPRYTREDALKVAGYGEYPVRTFRGWGLQRDHRKFAPPHEVKRVSRKARGRGPLTSRRERP